MTLYLDTSSLVKLYVAEPGSNEVRELVAAAAIVSTSVVAYPETRATFSRLRRSGHLSVSQFTTVKAEFETQWHTLLAVEVTAAVSREAGELAERYALRGFDALHLASFAVVARRAGPGQTRFSSFDVKLNKAATAIVRRLGSMG